MVITLRVPAPSYMQLIITIICFLFMVMTLRVAAVTCNWLWARRWKCTWRAKLTKHSFSLLMKFDCETNFRRTKSALIEVVVYMFKQFLDVTAVSIKRQDNNLNVGNPTLKCGKNSLPVMRFQLKQLIRGSCPANSAQSSVCMLPCLFSPNGGKTNVQFWGYDLEVLKCEQLIRSSWPSYLAQTPVFHQIETKHNTNSSENTIWIRLKCKQLIRDSCPANSAQSAAFIVCFQTSRSVSHQNKCGNLRMHNLACFRMLAFFCVICLS